MCNRYSKEYKKCIERSGGVTSNMIDSINNETSNIDYKIKKITSSLLVKIPEENSKALANAMKSWRQFLDYGSTAMYGLNMGTIESLTAAEWYLAEHVKMLVWLEGIAQKYEIY